MEFNIEQAALLLANIDPMDVETTEEAKMRKIPRWKNAQTYALALISAIRQGLITPVLCRTRYTDWDGNLNVEHIKPSDRDRLISTIDTVITRASLINWVNSEKIQITKPRSKTLLVTDPSNKQSEPGIIDVSSPPLALPFHGHKSEGLEFVEDAIKQFWITFDPDDPSTAPTKDEITTYLTSRGATGRMAEAVNLVLRPFGTRGAGLRNKKSLAQEDQ